MSSDIIFTDKMLDCIEYSLRDCVWVMAFEGSIRSIKTTTVIQMFHFLVQSSDEVYHLISAVDNNSIKDVLLFAKMGLITLYPEYYQLKKDEIGGYYIDAKCDVKNKPIKKRILLCGFENKTRWKKINGHEFGVILLDEANTANEQYINECFARQVNVEHPKMLMTMNGDTPTHSIYLNHVNHCKILGNAPSSIMADMAKAEKKPGYYYVHFTMADNPTMTTEKMERAKELFPKDSYYYKIKILGERGTSGRLIFNDYMDENLVVDLSKELFSEYTVGVDIGGNRAENSITLAGYKKDYSLVGLVDNISFKQCGYNEKKKIILETIKQWKDEGKFIRCVCVDSAESNFIIDLQAEFAKYDIDVIPSYKATIKERCDMLVVLLAARKLLFNSNKGGKALYNAYIQAKWEENKENEVREDKNLPINDKMDATEYALTRHMKKLMYVVNRYLKGDEKDGVQGIPSKETTREV